MNIKDKIKQALLDEDIYLSLTNEQREGVSDVVDYQLQLYIVKYRRELLIAFLEWEHANSIDLSDENYIIDEYLKSN